MKKTLLTTLTMLMFGINFLANAQWTALPSPKGFTVNNVTTFNSTFYLTTNKGIYTYQPGDASVKYMDTGIEDFENASMIYFKNAATIFAGTTGALNRSTDSGESWILLNNDISDLTPYAMTSSGDTLFLTTNGAAFRSLNNGANWTNLNWPTHAVNRVEKYGDGYLVANNYSFRRSSGLNTLPDTYYYVGDGVNIMGMHTKGDTAAVLTSAAEIILSYNNGGNWSKLGVGDAPLGAGSIVLEDDFIWVSSHDSLFSVSYNGGVKEAVSNFPNESFNHITKSGANMIMSGAGRLAYSADIGKNWSTIDNGFPARSLEHYVAQGNKVYARSDAKEIYKLNNQGGWTLVCPPYRNNFAASSMYLVGDAIFINTGYTTQVSLDAGISWSEAIDKSLYSFIQLDDGTMMAYGDRIGVVVSSDGGLTWNSSNLGIDEPLRHTTALLFENSGKVYFRHFFGLLDDKVYSSSDLGASWEEVGDSYKSLKHIGQIEEVAGIDYAMTAYPHSVVYRAVSNNEWDTLSLDNVFRNGHSSYDRFYSFTVDPATDIIYANAESGLYMYDGTSNGWRRMSRGLQTDIAIGGINSNEFSNTFYLAGNKKVNIYNGSVVLLAEGQLWSRPLNGFGEVPEPPTIYQYSTSSSGQVVSVLFNIKWNPSSTAGVTTYEVQEIGQLNFSHTLDSETTEFSFRDYFSPERVRSLRVFASVEGDNSAPSVIEEIASDQGLLHEISNLAEILNFELEEAIGDIVIDSVGQRIEFVVSDAVDITQLAPAIEVSDSATVFPGSLEVVDFTNDVIYKVTSESGLIKEWVAHAEIYYRSSAKDILEFSLAEEISTAIIDLEAHSLTVEVDGRTDLTNLIPTIVVSDSASISPASGVSQDFSSPVTYTVTAENETTRDWEVNVTLGPLAAENELVAALRVYPNPGASLVTLKGLTTPLERLQIVDMTGTAIEADFSNQNDGVSVNIEKLSPGPYFLKGYSKGKIFYIRILKE
ncbi:MAG: DUF5018 domain-containing protein [Imperialibacter sp.]|uniref:DUF5018 domain-containing protein n=1 Tax=Imperialibacter sp. TaxID=2038411 RepID=UPI0032F03959